MLKLRLLNQRLLIDPPQNLLVVWITDEASGAQFTVFHESGSEAKGMALAGTPIPMAESHRSAATDVPMLLPADYLRAFPDVSEIDLSNVPRPYKAITNPVVDRFDIRVGQTYSISFAGNVMVQATVVAE